jgi:hypothetical protein
MVETHLANTVLIVNCEHMAETQVYYINAGFETSDTIDARRWFVRASAPAGRFRRRVGFARKSSCWPPMRGAPVRHGG